MGQCYRRLANTQLTKCIDKFGFRNQTGDVFFISINNDCVVKQRSATTRITVECKKPLRRQFIWFVIVFSRSLIHAPAGLADTLFSTRERNTINHKSLAINKFVFCPANFFSSRLICHSTQFPELIGYWKDYPIIIAKFHLLEIMR